MEKTTTEMPHIGEMLRNYMKSKAISQTKCAEKMGVHPTQISKYLKNPTLQMDTFWKFCIALDHDFMSELLPHLPVYTAPEEDPRIREMQMQIDIYKDLLKR